MDKTLDDLWQPGYGLLSQGPRVKTLGCCTDAP